MKRLTVILVVLIGCAGAQPRPTPEQAQCAASCERAYGKKMPGAHLDAGNACYCMPDVVLLTAKLKPSAYILNGGQMPQPVPSK